MEKRRGGFILSVENCAMCRVEETETQDLVPPISQIKLSLITKTGAQSLLGKLICCVSPSTGVG